VSTATSRTVLQKQLTCNGGVLCLAFVLTDIMPPILNVETACLSEASVSICKARRYNNTDDALNSLRQFLDELSDHKLLNEFPAPWR